MDNEEFRQMEKSDRSITRRGFALAISGLLLLGTFYLIEGSLRPSRELHLFSFGVYVFSMVMLIPGFIFLGLEKYSDAKLFSITLFMMALISFLVLGRILSLGIDFNSSIIDQLACEYGTLITYEGTGVDSPCMSDIPWE